MLYVHAGGNFRDNRATIKPYKGNRENAKRPKYYNEIRQYMFDVRGAIPVRTMESDDAIGIEQFSRTDKYSVICTQDKDLKMIPGWHYDWVRDELFYQSITDANNFLFWQMLVGDTADNIPGINRVGPKRADAIMQECRGDTAAIREKVKELYEKQYGETWARAYQEVADLLWILRQPYERDTGCPLL